MRSYFRFNKQERRGIFFLLALIGGVQFSYFLFSGYSVQKTPSQFTVDSAMVRMIDSLKTLQQTAVNTPMLPFNPNFISDYKGYLLGMSVAEIDRLQAFRKQGQYVQTATGFQEVTGISDSLLKVLAPFFKFPEFAKRPKPEKPETEMGKTVLDLNLATEEELQRISGIGPVLSRRILNFRRSLGGFLVKDQLYDVYGLEPEVVIRAMERFDVLSKPSIKKIGINTATVDEIASCVYLNRALAERIVRYRNRVGAFDSISELTKIEDFPNDKIDRIKLYLAL
jgi:DNA uptake protein ComE-like DNA-binding protein